MRYFKKKNFLIPAVLCIAGFCFGQQTDFSKILNTFKQKKYNKTLVELQKIDTSKISQYDKATWFYYSADYNSIIDNHHIAYQNIS